MSRRSPKYELLSKEKTEEMLKLFKGERTGFVLVSPKKFSFRTDISNRVKGFIISKPEKKIHGCYLFLDQVLTYFTHHHTLIMSKSFNNNNFLYINISSIAINILHVIKI